MKAFNVPESTRFKVVKVTPRKETHGKELVQAVSLRLEWWPTENAALNLLDEGLQDMIFWTPPEVAAQCDLDGIPPVKKHRRSAAVEMPWKVKASFTGYTFLIDQGIDASSALELYTCTLDKFTADAKEGGSAIIAFSLASNKQITPQLVGALCALEGSEIVGTLTPPAVQEGTEATGAEIDGSKGHPGAAEGQGSLLDTEADGGEGGGQFDRWQAGEGGPEDQPAEDDDEGSGTDAAAFKAGAAQAVEKAKRRGGARVKAH